MEAKKPATTKKEKHIIEAFLYRYLPYWPLFAILLLLAGVAAYAYLYIATPVYEISANVLVKDEKKGADDSKILDALNLSSESKIVENEIEVIRSKDLLKEVVDSLQLYAPVFEDRSLVTRSAYNSSPIAVEMKDPYSFQPDPSNPDAYKQIYFTYHKKNNAVTVAGKTYPLNTWVSTWFGTARFKENPHLKSAAANPLYFSLNSPQDVINGLDKNLVTTATAKLSTVINLTIRDEVPERGKDILNLLIQDYNHAAINDKTLLASNTLSFVEERIQHVSKELDSIENRLQTFRTQKGVVDLSEQGRLYLQNVGDNDRKMTDLNMELSMLNEAEKYVLAKSNQIGIVPSIAGIRDPLLAQLLQKLYESQIQYERLKKTVPGENPMMVSLKNEIENMRPTILENIQNQRLSLIASKSNLNATTNRYSAMLQSIPQKEKGLLEISRQQAIKNDAYSFLLQKREEAALASSATVADSRTIEHPYSSPNPVSPKKNFVIAVAIAIALLIGFAIVNGKELLNNKILFRSDIEELTSIPIAAEIVKVKSKQSFIESDGKPSGLAEQFRQLRTALGLNGRQLRNKKILVTSSIASEGKSFICNNLALILAMAGKKVVIVDLDLRNPKTTSWHDLTGKKGIVSFLENKEEPVSDIIYQSPRHPNLYIVPVGTIHSNPTELLINGDLRMLFESLEKDFDLILVDTAPVDPVTDAYVLAEYCDATLFVIRHAFTPKAMVQLLDENNKIKALRNIAIVFNGIKARGFFNRRYGFGFGYGREKVYGEKAYHAENT